MPPLQDETISCPSPVDLPTHAVMNANDQDLQVKKKSKSKVAKKTKAVHFATNVKIHRILRRQDMSQDEITKVWMDRLDRRENKRDITNTIHLMRSGFTKNSTEEEFFCPRGLEHLVNLENEQSVEGKKSIGIALAMQRVLRKAGASNPVMIARAYRNYTITSQQVAYERALYDEAFASWSPDQRKSDA